MAEPTFRFTESIPPPLPEEAAAPPTTTTIGFREFANLKGTETGRYIKRSQGTFYLVCSMTIVATALLIATSSIGINVYNSCVNFGPSADRVAGLQTFFIVMLIFSILFFAAAIAALVIYIRYWKNIAV